MMMPLRHGAKTAILSLPLLLWGWAASAQTYRSPVRVPVTGPGGVVITAPFQSGAPTLSPLVAPTLQAPSLTPSLVPNIQAPDPVVSPTLAAPWVQTKSGLFVPARAVETGLDVQKPLSDPAAVSAPQVLNSVLDSRQAVPAVRGVPVSEASGIIDARAKPRLAKAAVAKTDYLQAVLGKTGDALLRDLHDLSGRGYRAHDYKDASRHLFGNVDNILSHGVHGVVDAYSGIFVPGTSANGGDYGEKGDQNGDGWVDRDGMNVEHTWPQSFFDKSLPMRSDLHHLLPTFQHPNSMRSNLPFGEVTGIPEYATKGGAKLGGGVFEPPDVSKGKVARAVLYFYTRYYDRNITQGAYGRNFWDSKLEMFLRWNREHPPDADELNRNERIEAFQGNRNPFTDDTGLAERVGVDGFRRMSGQGSVSQNFDGGRSRPGRAPRPDNGRKHGKHGRHYAPPARLSPLDFSMN